MKKIPISQHNAKSVPSRFTEDINKKTMEHQAKPYRKRRFVFSFTCHNIIFFYPLQLRFMFFFCIIRKYKISRPPWNKSPQNMHHHDYQQQHQQQIIQYFQSQWHSLFHLHGVPWNRNFAFNRNLEDSRIPFYERQKLGFFFWEYVETI